MMGRMMGHGCTTRFLALLIKLETLNHLLSKVSFFIKNTIFILVCLYMAFEMRFLNLCTSSVYWHC